MHKGSDVHPVAKLLESFDEDQKDQVLTTVKSLSSVVDKLKMLVERVQEQGNKDV